MAPPKQIVTSLLTEHFRYTPLTLIDDIINTVNELVYRAVTAVEDGLTAAPASSLGFSQRRPSSSTPSKQNLHSPQKHTISSATKSKRQQDKVDSSHSIQPNHNDYDEARVEIENGVHQLETLLEKHVDKNFDRLEIYLLRNVLTVPEGLEHWIRLCHYEDLDLASLSTHNAAPSQLVSHLPSPQTLVTLRRKLHESQKLHAALSAESSRNRQVITKLHSVLSPTSANNDASFSSMECTTASAEARNLSFLTNSAALKSLSDSQAVKTKSRRSIRGSSVAERPAPLTSSAQSLTSRDLPALRQVLSNLREAQLSGVLAKAPAADPHAVERGEYIDFAVRDAVSRVRDDNPGRDFMGSKLAAMTGEGSSPANIGRDEIQAIEKIAGGHGDNASSNARDNEGDTKMSGT